MRESMIASSIYAKDDCSKYPKSIQTAIEYIKNHDFTGMKPGDYPIDGTNIYAKVFDITSKKAEDTHPEVHKEYIDVQFWVSGEELMGFAPLKKEYEIIEEHKEQDLYFLGEIENESFLKAVQGDYMVFFPNDIHRPGVAKGQPLNYRKVVVKVHVGLG